MCDGLFVSEMYPFCFDISFSMTLPEERESETSLAEKGVLVVIPTEHTLLWIAASTLIYFYLLSIQHLKLLRCFQI